MKILQIADTHYGARSDNINLINCQSKFFERVFFPIIDREKPDLMVHLGDLIDNRNSLNLRTWNRMRADFLSHLKGLDKIWLIGNHDISYKNELSINIQSLIDVEGMVINSPCFYNNDTAFLSWICKENREESLYFIKNHPKKYLFGHLELAGFPHGGTISKGDDPVTFKDFGNVYSGHFHTKSKVGNVQYIGSAFALNWGDFGQWRGFNILDTETGKVTWYRNPFNIFSIIHYNEDQIPENLSQYRDTYCRIFVVSKSSDIKFQDFIKKIKDQGIINLDIIEVEVTNEVDSSKIRFIDNEQEIFIDHIKGLDFEDQSGVELLFRNLYERAKGEQF